jgi:hypothetical protein
VVGDRLYTMDSDAVTEYVETEDALFEPPPGASVRRLD